MKSMRMEAYIVRRHSVDWRSISDRYRTTGNYDPASFLPSPLPVGFPADIRPQIDLWNATFALDFFRVRAELATISEQSFAAVDGAELVQRSDLPAIVNRTSNVRTATYFFVDDDDWFAPHLIASIPSRFHRFDAVRWSDCVFDGELKYRPVQRFFPRLALWLRDQKTRNPVRYGWLPNPLERGGGYYGLPAKPIDWLFQTNNYGLTGRFVERARERVGALTDHVEAARYFSSSRHSILSLPRHVLSVTNKHPCSATHLGLALQGENPRGAALRYVSRFVEAGRSRIFPTHLHWLKPLIQQTVDLFEAALPVDSQRAI